MQTTPEQAAVYLKQLLQEKEHCLNCVHPPFTGVILDFFLSQGEDEGAARAIQAALRDTAMSASCSSQAVEKMHAHVQVAQNTSHNPGPRPRTVQRETYILSARLAHARLKGLIEQEVFGPNGLSRARKLMGTRVVSRSKASNTSLRAYVPKEGASVRRQRAFVRQHVLKLQKTKRTQAAPNTWHAFLTFKKGQKLRDDSQGLSDSYHAMMRDPVQRQQLQDKAVQMADDRNALANNVLGSNVDTPSLSQGQKRRLGHVQLDKSLVALVQHPAWKEGLRVHDSNTALAAHHVIGEEDDGHPASASYRKQAAEAVYGFDSKIVQNPERLPTLSRTCREMHGGLCCRKTPNCDQAGRCVS